MTRMIYDWGHLDENGMLRYATNPLNGICNPTEEHLRAAGEKPIVKELMPEPHEGGHYEETAPTDTGDIIVIDWTWVEDEPIKPTQEDYDRAMEAHLAQERQERGYTTREPSEYKDSSVPRWAQDAADWIAHRDAVMVYALGVINHYAETGEAPTLDEFKAALPKIVWTVEV